MIDEKNQIGSAEEVKADEKVAAETPEKAEVSPAAEAEKQPESSQKSNPFKTFCKEKVWQGFCVNQVYKKFDKWKGWLYLLPALVLLLIFTADYQHRAHLLPRRLQRNRRFGRSRI